jgi:hypothetical protein
VLGQVLVVTISAPEEATDRALDHRPEAVVERRCRVRITGADARKQLAVVEGRGRKSRLRRASIR